MCVSVCTYIDIYIYMVNVVGLTLTSDKKMNEHAPSIRCTYVSTFLLCYLKSTSTLSHPPHFLSSDVQVTYGEPSAHVVLECLVEIS